MAELMQGLRPNKKVRSERCEMRGLDSRTAWKFKSSRKRVGEYDERESQMFISEERVVGEELGGHR